MKTRREQRLPPVREQFSTWGSKYQHCFCPLTMALVAVSWSSAVSSDGQYVLGLQEAKTARLLIRWSVLTGGSSILLAYEAKFYPFNRLVWLIAKLDFFLLLAELGSFLSAFLLWQKFEEAQCPVCVAHMWSMVGFAGFVLLLWLSMQRVGLYHPDQARSSRHQGQVHPRRRRHNAS